MESLSLHWSPSHPPPSSLNTSCKFFCEDESDAGASLSLCVSVDVSVGDGGSLKCVFGGLVSGGCAYSEVPVAQRDELSAAVTRSIHHGAGPQTQEDSTKDQKTIS